MTEKLWNNLVEVARSLAIEPSLYDKEEMLGNSVVFHHVVAGNYKRAWLYWMKLDI